MQDINWYAIGTAFTATVIMVFVWYQEIYRPSHRKKNH